MRLLAAALVCALSTAINWEGRPLPDVLEEIELLARRLRRSELERLREDGILDDQAFEHGVDFVMRRGGGMAAAAAVHAGMVGKARIANQESRRRASFCF